MKSFFKRFFSSKKKVAGTPLPKDDEKEYSFIWYKKMQVSGAVTSFTQPFRTKVRAKNRDEAVEKVTNFAMGKMKLVICEEKYFDKDLLGRLRHDFDIINKRMEEFFRK